MFALRDTRYGHDSNFTSEYLEELARSFFSINYALPLALELESSPDVDATTSIVSTKWRYIFQLQARGEIPPQKALLEGDRTLVHSSRTVNDGGWQLARECLLKMNSTLHLFCSSNDHQDEDAS